MKKTIAFLCFVVLAAACTNQPANNMTTNTNSGEKKSMAGPSESDIIAKEKAGWDTFRRKDADAFKKLMAPEYVGVNNTGVEDTAIDDTSAPEGVGDPVVAPANDVQPTEETEMEGGCSMGAAPSSGALFGLAFAFLMIGRARRR